MSSELALMAKEKYVLLTTFRKTGEGVSTPIWIAGDEKNLLVWTNSDSGKVKRIRRNEKVTLQACDIRGKKSHGPVVQAKARILDADSTIDGTETNTAEVVRKAIARKYGLIGRISLFSSALFGGKDRSVGISISAID
jgi:hypothetical protein